MRLVNKDVKQILQYQQFFKIGYVIGLGLFYFVCLALGHANW
jgi:hypothetical protein